MTENTPDTSAQDQETAGSHGDSSMSLPQWVKNIGDTVPPVDAYIAGKAAQYSLRAAAQRAANILASGKPASNLGRWGYLAGLGGKIVSKVALPVTLALGAYQIYKGYSEAGFEGAKKAAVDLGLTTTGAFMGGAAGASLGSFLGPAGTLVGGIGGSVTGAIWGPDAIKSVWNWAVNGGVGAAWNHPVDTGTQLAASAYHGVVNGVTATAQHPIQTIQNAATRVEHTIAVPGASSSSMATTDGSTLAGSLAAQSTTTAADVDNNYHFATNSADLTEAGKQQLAKLAEEMKAHPEKRFELAGAADVTGNDTPAGKARNLALSQQRAEAVRDSLITAGVPADQLSIKGIGVEGDTNDLKPEDLAQHRHVTVTEVAASTSGTPTAPVPTAAHASNLVSLTAASSTVPSASTEQGAVQSAGLVPTSAQRANIAGLRDTQMANNDDHQPPVAAAGAETAGTATARPRVAATPTAVV